MIQRSTPLFSPRQLAHAASPQQLARALAPVINAPNSAYARTFTRELSHATGFHGALHPNTNHAMGSHGPAVPSYADTLHATLAAKSAQRFADASRPAMPMAPHTAAHIPSSFRPTLGLHR